MDKKQQKAADTYPGVAQDTTLSNERVSKKRVRDEVKSLNNNPRNTDDEMP